MSTLTVRNIAGDTVAEYPDFEPGQPVRVLPDNQGCNFVGAGTLWSFVGPTRHPYTAVIRESQHGTTVHVNRNRLVAR